MTNKKILPNGMRCSAGLDRQTPHLLSNIVSHEIGNDRRFICGRVAFLLRLSRNCFLFLRRRFDSLYFFFQTLPFHCKRFFFRLFLRKFRPAHHTKGMLCRYIFPAVRANQSNHLIYCSRWLMSRNPPSSDSNFILSYYPVLVNRLTTDLSEIIQNGYSLCTV